MEERMYLKSIEVHGFKSFANKMVFEFHNGITAIVGPNGSGKSNVADAVRWVLGEQSAKQLRGAKMEDVIFSGTQTRKPLGFAYVAITLNNSDFKLSTSYEEVTVARRVYRSGESEYLMNGSVCRLKDVQELFLDTGIGKEGYSIIGQGQIDKILSGKPEERRELFDEAAGIVKFKKRKAAAEKNLDVEKQNLYRVQDILSELEKQMKPLEQQSIIAKEYLKYRDELKDLDINLFLIEYDHIHMAVLETEEKLKIVQSDLEETKKSYENTKEEYEQLETKIEQLTQELEERKKEINDSRIKKEQLEGQYNVLQEKINATKQNDTHYKDRMVLVKKEMEEKTKELEDYTKKRTELKENIQRQKTQQEQADALLEALLQEMAQIKKEIDRCNSDIFEYLNENNNVKSKMQRYEIMLEQDVIKKAGLNQKILQGKSDEAVFEEIMEKEHKKLLQVEERISSINDTILSIKEEVMQLDQEIANQQHELSELQKRSIAGKSKLDSLKNLSERYDGYGQSIRHVMEQKQKHLGIIGVVADIIKVKKEYETAIEIALGGSIQNIVTDHENTAKEMIEFLKRNKYGRATFLPLTAMNRIQNFQNERALKEEGVIGVASTLVETGQEFQGVVSHLLGRILVVDHIDHAILVHRKYQNSLRIVTLDGELLNPGGSMSGGAYKNTSNLLGRKREMEELEQVIASWEEQQEKIQNYLEKIKVDKGSKLKEIEEQNKELQSLYLEQNTSNIQYKQAEKEKLAITESYKEITIESKELDQQMKELRERIGSLQKEQQENESRSKENEVILAEYNKILEEKKQLEQVYRDKVSSVKLGSSAFEQKLEYLNENILRIEQEIEKFQLEWKHLEEEIQASFLLLKDRKLEMEQIQSVINELESKKEKLDQEITYISNNKDLVSKNHKGFLEKREHLSNHIIELERESARISNQKERLMEQKDSLITYMWEEYELTYNSAYALKKDTKLALSQIKKQISDVKGKIKQLGEVNVNAIEDFKQLSERYELLKTQHDDLIEAENILKGIIQDLDVEMRKQFEEKFQAIQLQFDLVFKELFGGGKGTLELMEEEDLLEAGIRIIAQPPGKKLQNMMQLSGGEKALTAISLLFAIQNLKPSPFCLLDEIEAALDDSNVGRYAKYLHKLTKDTQFIVITHRRGTMAAADILYGITMQEKGVSTLVSVNLMDEDLEKMES